MTVMTTTTSPDTEKEQAKSDQLNVSDRCDRCGAQAFVLAINEDHDLMFCNHHGKEHAEALKDQGFILMDESYKLNEKPSMSANAV